MRIIKIKPGQYVKLLEKPTHKMVCCRCGMVHGFCFLINKGFIELTMWEEKENAKKKHKQNR